MFDSNSIEEMYEKFILLRIEFDRICALEKDAHMKLPKETILLEINRLGKFLERNGYDIEKINRDLL